MEFEGMLERETLVVTRDPSNCECLSHRLLPRANHCLNLILKPICSDACHGALSGAWNINLGDIFCGISYWIPIILDWIGF